MSVGVEVSYVDHFGKVKRGRYTAADATAAQAMLNDLKAVTNCRISHAAYTTELDTSAITANTAGTGDISAAEAQAAVTMTGPKLTGGVRREKVTIQIPAPKVAILTTNNLVDVNNATVVALLDHMVSAHGGTLDRVDSGRLL